MTELTELAELLLSASPTVLALLLGLLAVSICGFALFLVYRVIQGRGE
ncbi:hypothetical protein C8J30_1325 [Rhodobacter viridis]|uniref:Uncharacterized protein n=1 Tax=Rhodobacter viridis TaxID=1054202 RepID=A0A318TN16_9RHOB|nr:hypothetical protein [Rhodobacter viridis]PYF06271.1 hypothetical protein C8J30_1325 [Rhodobacter viridis]